VGTGNRWWYDLARCGDDISVSEHTWHSEGSSETIARHLQAITNTPAHAFLVLAPSYGLSPGSGTGLIQMSPLPCVNLYHTGVYNAVSSKKALYLLGFGVVGMILLGINRCHQTLPYIDTHIQEVLDT
jgi:hypothetical protein